MSSIKYNRFLLIMNFSTNITVKSSVVYFWNSKLSLSPYLTTLCIFGQRLRRSRFYMCWKGTHHNVYATWYHHLLLLMSYVITHACSDLANKRTYINIQPQKAAFIHYWLLWIPCRSAWQGPAFHPDSWTDTASCILNAGKLITLNFLRVINFQFSEFHLWAGVSTVEIAWETCRYITKSQGFVITML